MDELLTDIARAAMALNQAPHPMPAAAVDVLQRIDDFAREHEGLDPETHTRLLVQVARNLDRACPADAEQARIVIEQSARMVRRFSGEEN